jgi:hypothetical protein
LAQDLQDLALELGQLSQEKHTVVGQRHFSRHGDMSADQPRIRDGVRRGAKRPGRHQRGAVAGQAGDAVDALRVNAKEKEAGSQHPEREAQFPYIAAQTEACTAAGCPSISVDPKKKELMGDFKNAGQLRCQHPIEVNVHDFPGDAVGRAVPYGIYDLQQKAGAVYVGLSADTPEWAVTAIEQWWEARGHGVYPQGTALRILADGGGSNGWRSRVWKAQRQSQLSDRRGLRVKLCH